MSQITDFKITPFKVSKFIQPLSACYKQNGVAIRWDFIRCFDCVSTFIYHREKDSFLFVRQFRAPLCFYNDLDTAKGYSIELCSGICDKQLSAEQIAIEECKEELGLNICNVQFWGEFYTGFGTGVGCAKLFFAVVSDSDFSDLSEDFIGGCDLGEHTERVWVKRSEFNEFFSHHPRSALIEYAYLKFCLLNNYNL